MSSSILAIVLHIANASKAPHPVDRSSRCCLISDLLRIVKQHEDPRLYGENITIKRTVAATHWLIDVR